MTTRRTRCSLCFAILLSLLGAGPEPAPAQWLGPEFQVNSYTTGTQYRPVIAAAANGNFGVVWRTYQQDGSSFGLAGRWFDSAANARGSDFQVNTYTSGYQVLPAMASDDFGHFVVVWTSVGQDGSGSGVFGQQFDAIGNPVGGEFQINTYTTSDQTEPAVAADDSGGFVVVWAGLPDGQSTGIHGQRFDASGVKVGSEFQINTYSTNQQGHPSVTVNGSGDIVVVWQSALQDGSGQGIFGQRFDAAGVPLAGEFQVNTYTTSDQTYPAIATDDAGGFIVAWRSTGQDGSEFGVFGKRFDAAGGALGSEFQVNTYTTGYQGIPSVAIAGPGSFVVVWESSQGGSGSGSFGQRYDADGSPRGSEFQVNTTTTGYQGYPAVAADAIGNFVVAWSGDGNQAGEGTSVFGKQLTTVIFTDDFERGHTCAWSASVGGGCP